MDIIEPLKNSTGQVEPIQMYYFDVNETISEQFVIYEGGYGPFGPNTSDAQLKVSKRGKLKSL